MSEKNLNDIQIQNIAKSSKRKRINLTLTENAYMKYRYLKSLCINISELVSDVLESSSIDEKKINDVKVVTISIMYVSSEAISKEKCR
jgi:hypothetical protein